MIPWALKTGTRAVSLVLAGAAVFYAPRTAVSAITATSADDICPPTADPCVIDQEVIVQPPGHLDFGTRAILVTGGGKLRGSAYILCGGFTVEVGATNVAVDTREPGNVAGSFRVIARGTCSEDPSVPCLTDVDCGTAGAGTCTGGGTVSIDGKILAQGNPGGFVSFSARGDINISGDILADGKPIGAEGGSVRLRSYEGNVTATGQIASNANPKGINYETVSGGWTGIYAAGEVILTNSVNAGGSHNGGRIRVDGESVRITGSLLASAGPGLREGSGGTIKVTAHQDLAIGEPGASTLRLAADGTFGADPYYPKYIYSGPGGNVYLLARWGDVEIAQPVVITANSGKRGSSYGGYVDVKAGQRVVLDGRVYTLGYGKLGAGGVVSISGDSGVSLGASSKVKTRSKYGGSISVYLGGPSRIDGVLDVRGKLASGVTYPYEGEAGEIDVGGPSDLAMSGTILQGAEFSNPVDISVCRLRLEGRALIDNTLGSPSNGERINVTVYESMYAGPQTRILADEEGGGEVRISYRDPAKPPVLLGQIKPAPTLTVAPALRGCPVCGNSEIDEGESCDDGNTVSGDGCRSDCQDEGCLAATPDWPNVALCEDYNDCTVDTCDPINHQCVNTVSCSDGIECTDDTCIGTTCQHTPNDLWCDDGNPCTDDVCNVTAGCVHANLNGVSCDDGDPCTLTGTCNTGICEVTDQRRASKSVIKARMLDGANNDRLVIKADFDLSLLASAPNVTGLNVDVYSPSGATVFSASIPASAFADKRGTGEKFQFKDAEGTTPGAGGTRLAVVRKITAKGIAKVKLKAIGNELGAAAGADVLSASMLFGADPASNDCVTAWMLQCRSRPGTTHCKS